MSIDISKQKVYEALRLAFTAFIVAFFGYWNNPSGQITRSERRVKATVVETAPEVVAEKVKEVIPAAIAEVAEGGETTIAGLLKRLETLEEENKDLRRELSDIKKNILMNTQEQEEEAAASTFN